MLRTIRIFPATLQRAHGLATWFCLVLLFVASLAGVQGLVVCLGADGHIAVERVLTADCTGCEELDEACASRGAQHDESEPHRGCDCTDISTSVLSTAAPRRALAGSAPLIDALACVLDRVALALPCACFDARPEPAPVPHDPGRERNVVLRT